MKVWDIHLQREGVGEFLTATIWNLHQPINPWHPEQWPEFDADLGMVWPQLLDERDSLLYSQAKTQPCDLSLALSLVLRPKNKATYKIH